MNTFLNNLIDNTNYATTENGAVTHKTTKSAVLDMFALCGAYRKSPDEACISAFREALEEDESLALKCLFYLRDVRGGQGERRFFRVCYKWLCMNYEDIALRNLEHIAEYGRWDDLIEATYSTPIWADAIDIIKRQLMEDLESKAPSLLGKWLPSENASSARTKEIGRAIRLELDLSHKKYRQMLSLLRKRINIVERLMSGNEWDEIQFDKLPSQAGLLYSDTFLHREETSKRYADFISNRNTKVNADVMNPVEIARRAFDCDYRFYYDKTNPMMKEEKLVLDKYWNNLADYYNGREENGLAIVDVSGSMYGQPLNAAVSMGAYIAERGHGPFANHFITFSSRPELVKFTGETIADKFWNCKNADWGGNTDLKAVFDLLLDTAVDNNTRPEDIPTRLYIFSDMEFDGCMGRRRVTESSVKTLLEEIALEWEDYGYELPQVVFWNLDARHKNIPAMGKRFSYVSGFSMSMIESILSGKTGYDLMLEKLLSERYSQIC